MCHGEAMGKIKKTCKFCKLLNFLVKSYIYEKSGILRVRYDIFITKNMMSD